MKHRIFLVILFAAFGPLSYAKIPLSPATVSVEASGKTDDVKSVGDAADDTAIYVNRKTPGKSLILGTDKHSGLSVFDLSGKRIQEFPDGDQNNVDLRYGFDLGTKSITIIGTGNRSTNTMDFYSIDQKTHEVERLSVKEHPAGIEIYGSCFYQSPTKKLYFFVNSKEGEVVQWEISGTKDAKLQPKEVRRFDVGTQVEGCVADDHFQTFYIGEEEVGIWRYGAEPSSKETRHLIDSTTGGHLVADVEGLALYRIGTKHGYLMASSQGENAFTIYDRKSGEYVGKFHVSYQGNRVEDCDGIEITSNYLNPSYPVGMIVVQDGNPIHQKQSFKMVPYHELALKFFPPLGMTLLDPLVP